MALTLSDLHPQFKFEVTAMPGGELVKRCFDCGSCAGICPVSKAEPEFDPRRILHMIKLGLKERLLQSKAIWSCSHCDSCQFVCPQDVKFCFVVDVLRDMAINEGYADSNSLEKWGTAPCKAACPANISIHGFVGAIAEGRYAEGLKLIKEEMPFPAICGRICPHPCEGKCNRGKIDQPVAIEFLKRFLADVDLSSETPYMPKKKANRSERVAVIGAGPAGLTVAYYLAIKGYPVTVFEKLPLAGGMMVAGIPGEDELDGVIDGLTFMREINLGNLPVPKARLVVIGGGNTAVDCSRTARRVGCQNVTILYRRTREEMPASPWEVEESLEEGVDIQFLTAPVKLFSENGAVCGVECIRMNLGQPDESGRRRPIPIEGSEFTVEADLVVTAIGQRSDLSCLSGKCAIDTSNNGLVSADRQTGATNISGVFAGGDVVHGPRTVVEAVAFGKEAALSIDRYLKGEDLRSGRERHWKGIEFAPPEAEIRGREPMPRLPLTERKRTFKEIDLGLNEEQARREAGRCFRICGIQKDNSLWAQPKKRSRPT